MIKEIISGIIPSGTHLSYPYIFKEGTTTYCIPETAEANEIGLYKIDTNDGKILRKERVLISGLPCLDSSIVKFQDKYWLFASVKGFPGIIYIYYASSLEDNFVSHSLNPILSDSKSYRNAGNMFIVDGELYRPTQNLEIKYGGSIIINRVKKLSEYFYESENFFEILPEDPYYEGIHTISFSNGLIVIDGKRKVFSFLRSFKIISTKIQKWHRQRNLKRLS